MKKNLLLLFLAFSMGTGLQSQVIFDWETPETSGTYQYFGSTLDGSEASVIANPNPTGVNTSATVLEFIKPAGAETWAGAFVNGDGPGEIDCTTGGQICVDVHMNNLGNLSLKLENATTGGANWITTQNNTVTGAWETLCFDLSEDGLEDDMTNAVGDIFTQLVLFADFGTPGGDEDQTYYFDNIVLYPATVVSTGCFLDWETPETSTEYQYFGSTLDGTIANIIANPNATGINESATVLEHVKPAGALTFAGAFAVNPGVGNIDCTEGGQICVDVHMDHLGSLSIKLENATTGGANWITTQNNTTINQWERLCFDLSENGFEDDMTNAVGDIFTQLVLFVDFGMEGTDVDVVTYIDNICLEETVNVNETTFDANLFTIAPNPAMDYISVSCDVREEKIVTILDINGSIIQQFTMAADQSTMNVTLGDIASGVYIMAVTSDKTRSAQRFVKR